MSILSTNKKLIKVGAEYSAGSGISIDNYVISVTGDVGGKTYSAGENIGIYEQDNQLYISGKDWSSEIADASANAYEQAISQIPEPQDLSYISAKVDTNTSGIDYISSVCITAQQDWTDTIKGASSYSYEQSTSYFDNWVNGQYAGDISNITNKITALSGDFGDYYKKTETSSKDEINDALQYVSANAGKVYEGVSPIVVNNTEDKISADTWTFSAGSNVSFVDDNVNKITRIDVELPQPQDLSYISAQTDKANQGVDYLSGVVITALPSDMATTGDIAELAQTISETYQTKGDYLVRSDSANFYPANNPSGFITGVDLSNYYTKDETSGKEELANAFANIPAGDTEVNAYVHNNSASIDESTNVVQSNSSVWNDITAYQSNSGSYLTAIDIPESATWNDVSETVQTNSSVWNDKLDASSLDLEIGQHYDFSPGITGAYKISGADILASYALADSQGRVITGWYQLKDDNLLSGTKYGTLKIDNENTHLVDTTFSALSSYNGVIVSAIPYSGAGFWNGYGDYHSDSTTSHSYDNVKSYSINMQSWDGGFTAQINGTNYDHSYFDGNHTITGEFNTPSTLVVNLYRSNNYAEPTIKQFNLGVESEINEVVDIRNVFTTNEQLNTASSYLSGAIDYVSANAGGGSTGNYVLKSDFTFVSDQWGTYLQKVSGKYIDYATRAGQAELDSDGHLITTQYFTTANANTLSSMFSAAIDYVSANAGGMTCDYVSGSNTASITDIYTYNYSATISGDISVDVEQKLGDSTYDTWHYTLFNVGSAVDNKLNAEYISASNTIKKLGEYDNHYEVVGKSYRESNVHTISASDVEPFEGGAHIGFDGNGDYLKSAIITIESDTIGSFDGGWTLQSSAGGSAVLTKLYTDKTHSDSTYLWSDWNITNINASATVYNGYEIAELAFKDEIPSVVTGDFVPQSAFDELKQSYDALSSLFATYSGQWLLPNEGV